MRLPNPMKPADSVSTSSPTLAALGSCLAGNGEHALLFYSRLESILLHSEKKGSWPRESHVTFVLPQETFWAPAIYGSHMDLLQQQASP